MNTEFFSPPATSRVRANGTLRLAMVSRLIRGKRVDLAIQAVAQLSTELSRRVHLTVVGDGPERDSLRKLARDCTAAHLVAFVGLVPPTRVREILRATDIYIHPTDGEGLSTSILQAMAVGLPVVASAVPGMEEPVEHGTTGLLVSGIGASDFAFATMQLMDPGRRHAFGAAGRSRAVERFSHQVMWNSYRALLHDLNPQYA